MEIMLSMKRLKHKGSVLFCGCFAASGTGKRSRHSGKVHPALLILQQDNDSKHVILKWAQMLNLMIVDGKIYVATPPFKPEASGPGPGVQTRGQKQASHCEVELSGCW